MAPKLRRRSSLDSLHLQSLHAGQCKSATSKCWAKGQVRVPLDTHKATHTYHSDLEFAIYLLVALIDANLALLAACNGFIQIAYRTRTT